MFELNVMLAEEPPDDICPLEAPSMSRYCQRTLEQQQLIPLDHVGRVEISIQMLDSGAMQALNNQYRQKNSATNVLSFESGMPLLNEPDSPSLLVLGDIVFCADVIKSEARQQGKLEAQHWAHMLVHGTLHLCGYDHVDPDEALHMEELEIQILSLCGISNPYQIQSLQ